MYYEDYFVPYPIIETERLVLRKVRYRDTAELFEILHDPRVSRYSRWSPHGSVGDTADFIRWQRREYHHRRLTAFVVTDKKSGAVLGTCSFVNVESDGKVVGIGYSLSPGAWGNGYGSETAWALTGFAFDVMRAQRVYAEVVPENERSVRLLKRLGFVFEGRAKKGFYSDGVVADVDTYAMTDEEYSALIKSGTGSPLRLIK